MLVSSFCSNVSRSDSSHCQTTVTFHPAASRRLVFAMSRSMFFLNFSSQKSRLDFGVVVYLQFSCLCQNSHERKQLFCIWEVLCQACREGLFCADETCIPFCEEETELPSRVSYSWNWYGSCSSFAYLQRFCPSEMTLFVLNWIGELPDVDKPFLLQRGVGWPDFLRNNKREKILLHLVSLTGADRRLHCQQMFNRNSCCLWKDLSPPVFTRCFYSKHCKQLNRKTGVMIMLIPGNTNPASLCSL